MPEPSRSRKRRNLLVFLAAGGMMLLAGSVALGVYLSVRPPLLDHTAWSTAYYDRNGHLLRLTAAKDSRYRLYTPLDKISPDLITATLTQEDRHFFDHPGVNPAALLRGLVETYVRHSRPVGGSTITMQFVRLRDGLNTRVMSGKITQMLRALQLECHYSKNDILEAYLNLVPYGGNIEGAGAAALIYFGQKAQALALPESLALAVIPQNPTDRAPLIGANQESWRAARLRLYKQLPSTYAPYARQMQLRLTVDGPARLPFLAPHFTDSLTPAPGSVSTTLDLDVQRVMERHIAAWIDRERINGIDNAAAMLVHFPSMEIRALVGSGDFFNRAIGGQVDGTAALRSPGSALKPFIYALAMDQGKIHPGTLLDDNPAAYAEYRPANFDRRFAGRLSARDALVMSRNIPAIALNKKLNPDLYDFLQDSGAGFPHPRSWYGLSLAIGSGEVSMRTLAKLYAMMANGGLLQDLKDGTGGVPAAPRRVLSAEAALLTLQMLDHPARDTIPFAVSNSTAPHIYWKTGTSTGFHDAWTAGVFGPYVLVVWTGHFDGSPNPAFVGVERAAPLFFELARTISARERVADLIGPALKSRNVSMVDICAATGAPGPCDGMKPGWFIPGKSPIAAPLSGPPAPKILSPREGIAYVASLQSSERLQIPLQADDAPAQDTLFWFDGNRLIGSGGGKTALLWTPSPGRHTIHLVNAAGMTATETINVMSAE